jgi:hypothetical protein
LSSVQATDSISKSTTTLLPLPASCTKREDQDYVIGDRTYALHISDNVLIQGDPTDVLNKIADAMIGFTYLPFTSSWQGNPALQPGDIIQQTDRKGVQYRTIVTNSTYAYRGVCNLSAKGASEIGTQLSVPANKKSDTASSPDSRERSQNRQPQSGNP